MGTLVWFRNDLRIENNRLLDKVKELKNAKVVVLQEPVPFASIDDFITYSKKKVDFQQAAIAQFVRKMKNLGVEIEVLFGNAHKVLPQYCVDNEISKIFTSRVFDMEEERNKRDLEQALAKNEIYVDYIYNNTWIPIDELPFPLKRTPKKFKEFMKEIKGLDGKFNVDFELDEDLDFMEELVINMEQNNMYELRKYSYIPNNNFFQFLPVLTSGRISSPALLKWLEKRYKSTSSRTKILKMFKQQLFMYEHMKLQYFGEPELNFVIPSINREPEIKQFQKWVQGETKHPMLNAIMKKVAKSSEISLTSKKLAIDYYNHVLELPPFWGYWYFKKQLMEYSSELNAFLWKQSLNTPVEKREILTSIADLSLKLDPKNKFTDFWMAS